MSRAERQLLSAEVTCRPLGDPAVLTKSWTSAWRTYSLSANDENLTENFCTNNENVEQFLKLAEQERAR